MTLDPTNRWDPATFESEGGAVDDVTQTNGKRAARAHATLERYEQLQDGWPDNASVTDLLSDLMHWCHRDGTNFDEALKLARMHYRAETAHRRSRAAQKTALKRRQQKRSAAVLVRVR